MKKIPSNSEEFLVWPPIGGGCGLFVGFTLDNVAVKFHSALLNQPDSHYLIGYLFPILMGLGLAYPLHGKYWLGFAWLGFITYLCSYFLHFFSLSSAIEQLYILISCLSLMFFVQSLSLYGKRVTIHRGNT